MRAVVVRTPGGPEVLELAEVPVPVHGPEDLLVRVFAAGVNRADILQRRGLYPPPPGESDILGLEFAGEVAEAGSAARGFRRGDRVFGLVGGGAYAEFVKVHHRLAFPIPDTFSFEAAAAVPEAFMTAYENLFVLGGLEPGHTVLVHAAASGVGTAALQLAAERGAQVIGTTRTAGKAAFCRGLGADTVLVVEGGRFAEAVRDATGGTGADIVLDLVGASYWSENLEALARRGTILLVGLVGGRRVEVDLGALLSGAVTIRASTLRGRTLEEKIAAADRFRERVLPLLEAGRLRPVLDRVYLFEEVQAAHERMERNENTGKIVLRL